MKRPIAAIGLVLAALCLYAQPAAAGTGFRDVSPTGSDASNDCSNQNQPCATIQHAIDEAENGDWVSVAPGVYEEEVTIDKPLTLIGPDGGARPGEPQAVIEGGAGTAISADSKRISIRALTASAGPAGTAIRTSGTAVDELWIYEDIIRGGSTGVLLEAGGEETKVTNNVIEGVGDGIRLVGANHFDLEIFANQLSSISEHSVLAQNGAEIAGFEMIANDFPAPVRIAAKVARSAGQENDIDRNSFTSMSGPQLAVAGNEMRLLDNTFEGHGNAGCLEILGEEGPRAAAEDVFVSGSEFDECDPYGVEIGPGVNGIRIGFNQFPSSYDGVLVSGETPWDVTGHVEVWSNRIVGTTHLGVDNQASGTLDAEQNWWGCNGGPGKAGCDAVSSGVDTEDNAVLAALIGPLQPESGIEELPTGNSITLKPGEKAEVAAFLLINGLGINYIPSENIPLSFSSTLGTLSPEISTLFNGWTKSVFTAGTVPGHGSVVVGMDNAQARVPVTIAGGAAETPPQPQPPPPAESPPPPSLAVTRRHNLHAGKSTGIGAVTCPVACLITPDRPVISIGGHRYRGMVTPKGALPAETARPIRITLPGAALRALKRVGKGTVKVTITVTDAGGRTAMRTISAKLSD